MTLRTGITTGTCAAAAAKAAATLLAGGAAPTRSRSRSRPDRPSARRSSSPARSADGAAAAVRKDAGDDPDVTHGMEIVVAASWSGEPGVTFAAGEGVGTVTKPGLQIPPGQPAINPVPRRMIAAAVQAASAARSTAARRSRRGFRPRRTRGGPKTFNPRLGIEGGLSILGTTGIVRPYCGKAICDSLQCAGRGRGLRRSRPGARSRQHRRQGRRNALPAPRPAVHRGRQRLGLRAGSPRGRRLRGGLAGRPSRQVGQARRRAMGHALDSFRSGRGNGRPAARRDAGSPRRGESDGRRRLFRLAAGREDPPGRPAGRADATIRPSANLRPPQGKPTFLSRCCWWTCPGRVSAPRETSHHGNEPSAHFRRGLRTGRAGAPYRRRRRAVAEAEALVGSRRLLDLFADGGRQERTAVEGDVAAALAAIETHRAAGRRVAVLVSGDPGLFSLARCVAERFGRANCRFLPGISSVQLAFARLGLDWSDARILSAHARAPQADVEELRRCDKLAVLGGGREGRQWIAAAAAALAETHEALLCENLSLDERADSADDARGTGLRRRRFALPGPLHSEVDALMTAGTLYGIGVGPGNPQWITVQAAEALAQCHCVYAPRARDAAESVALEIAAPLLEARRRRSTS